ncbi:unnamed protein product [Acanthoscelides obtectus]|uniref:G-protein coupled receptors family 1 profile domain-containing protein n=1 Tax=Acanthoscelides obtectus TaxID=200917 RepID=A0A9P0Q7N0_ACAOB|nr:unnamed protein product [Acanthoscelides obtectus]CAK1621649.1 5-hydroxytryptamine receptor 2B [Acanthoscelides obtectus]
MDTRSDEAYAVMKHLSSNIKKRDNFDVYGEYVANTLRNLQNKSIVASTKFQINNILYQAENADMSENTPGPSISSTTPTWSAPSTPCPTSCSIDNQSCTEDTMHLGDSVVVSATILDDVLHNTAAVVANCSSCWRNASSSNSTTNDTAVLDDEDVPTTSTVVIIFLSTILGLMILVTVVGNVFVITAIFIDRNLQSVANYLIVSLAVADLMVACLVMPLDKQQLDDGSRSM